MFSSKLYRGIRKFRFILSNSVKAFTLAEVLITLGIIGVVAALTIPTLIGNINDTKFRTQFFKSYSTISQVVKKMEADDIPLTPKSYDRINAPLKELMKNYLVSYVDCYIWKNRKNVPACFDWQAQSYSTMDGNGTVNSRYFDDGEFLLADGSLLLIEQPDGGEGRIWFFVDVNNASNPPNKLGYDLFVFQMTEDGLKPMGQVGTTYVDTDASKYCDKNGSGELNGVTCAYKLIQNSHDYYKWLRRKGD